MINGTTNYQQYSSMEKPGFFKSVGKGISTQVKTLIPIYNLYMVGDEYSKIETAKDTLENIKAGSLEYEEKNWLQKTAKGLGKTLLAFIPVIGTYSLGKAKNEKENLKDQIAGNDVKKAGFFKNLFTGIGERIKLLIPFYNTYYIGKENLEATNIQNDIAKIYSNAINSNFEKNYSSFDAQLSKTLEQINTLAASGLIDDKNMAKTEQIMQEIEAIKNNPTLSETKKAEEELKLATKLSSIINKI